NYLDPFSPIDTNQREQVIAAIERAVESGITYFDTAAAYGTGESRRYLVKGWRWLGLPGGGTIFTLLQRSVTARRIHVDR
ncbi:MAG: aldo/keto reductase, partial [Dehalococcoidia bacterium]